MYSSTSLTLFQFPSSTPTAPRGRWPPRLPQCAERPSTLLPVVLASMPLRFSTDVSSMKYLGVCIFSISLIANTSRLVPAPRSRQMALISSQIRAAAG